MNISVINKILYTNQNLESTVIYFTHIYMYFTIKEIYKCSIYIAIYSYRFINLSYTHLY